MGFRGPAQARVFGNGASTGRGWVDQCLCTKNAGEEMFAGMHGMHLGMRKGTLKFLTLEIQAMWRLVTTQCKFHALVFKPTTQHTNAQKNFLSLFVTFFVMVGFLIQFSPIHLLHAR